MTSGTPTSVSLILSGLEIIALSISYVNIISNYLTIIVKRGKRIRVFGDMTVFSVHHQSFADNVPDLKFVATFSIDLLFNL